MELKTLIFLVSLILNIIGIIGIMIFMESNKFYAYISAIMFLVGFFVLFINLVRSAN